MKIISGSTQDLRDTASFIELLDRLPEYLPEKGTDFFAPHRELVVTRAPGRLDLMGGIADYSGSLVLEIPIESATHAALQRQENETIEIISIPARPGVEQRCFEMALADFMKASAPVEYAQSRERFNADARSHWAAYVAGAFLVLMRERGVVFKEGARILIGSDMPEGKGVSSSAALEVSVMMAVAAAYGIEMSPQEMAFLCQSVENLVAGAPCGVMDQMTSACGEADKLLALLCQPGEVLGTIKLPEELEVWGIDSGIRHAVGGADYARVRAAAFMGYRIIAEVAGLPVRESEIEGVVQIDDTKWKGYLANLTPREFESSYAPHLPSQMAGSEFLKRYKGITDRVTSVKPELEYPVRAAARHPVYEHARVQSFMEILERWQDIGQAERLGELMYQSHASYSSCGLGSTGTDELVRIVREIGAACGLYGAKITGGGSGGTVAVLCRRGAGDSVKSVAEEYTRRTDLQPTLIVGSSPGAYRFGHLRLMKDN
jgi:galactokinase